MSRVLSDQNALQVPLSTEEDDLLRRSSKKVRNTAPDNVGKLCEEQWPRIGENPRAFNAGGPSFVDKLKGTFCQAKNLGVNEDQMEDDLSDDTLSDKSFEVSGAEKEVCKIVENPMRNFPSFCFSSKMKKRLCKAWSRAIIVKLLGRNIGFRTLENRLQTMWAKRGVLTLINVGHGYHIVKFTNQDDYMHALTGAPWMIFDHYLTVQPWEANFKLDCASIEKAAVWVTLPKLPLEYYDEEALTIIENRIGKTIRVDLNTSNKLRGHFARICVLVELGKQLMQGFYLDGIEIYLEYEGLHQLCANCGIYGHKKELCPLRKQGNANMGECSKEQAPVGGEQPDQNVEPQWRVVQRNRRPKKAKDKVAEASAV
ncbi:hypothetical protein QN277_007869 [Acacia crassicarpa]|uniref:DUF4283 domain-containing protein n=1 Tax=Acacia crassicarpa TaxID=499986 RepID=A0AAE1MAX2_9FABA|nr:hypothetical protein QN277_007869 [Acacia crassicarpa]